MRKIRRYLSTNDEERIRLAVAEAKSHTHGDIVPMIVRSSDSYAHLHVTGGLLFAVMAFAIAVRLWPITHPSWFLIAELLGYFIGSLLFRIDGVKRLFLRNQEMDDKVYQRAVRAFYEHDLHKTKESAGILILASLLERRVRILADRGIHEKVGDAEWRKAANLLTRALKEKQTGDGFCEAIAVCGDVLARHFPVDGEKFGKNPDELSDQPIHTE